MFKFDTFYTVWVGISSVGLNFAVFIYCLYSCYRVAMVIIIVLYINICENNLISR